MSNFDDEAWRALQVLRDTTMSVDGKTYRLSSITFTPTGTDGSTVIDAEWTQARTADGAEVAP